MPHDKRGRLIEAGDIVSVQFRVLSVCANDDYCNVSLETVDGMPPSGNKTQLSAINTRQVEKVDVSDSLPRTESESWVINR